MNVVPFIFCLLILSLVLAIGGLVTAGAFVAVACVLYELLKPYFLA